MEGHSRIRPAWVADEQGVNPFYYMAEAADGGHDGLIRLLSIPPDAKQAQQLARLSTCALAIRAALYWAGWDCDCFSRPYRPGKAMADLWTMLGYPWRAKGVADRGVVLVGPWPGRGMHVFLGMRAMPLTPEPDTVTFVGWEGGQVDQDGRQVVQECVYKLHEPTGTGMREGKWTTNRYFIGMVSV